MLRCTGGPCIGETITIDTELVLGRGEPDPGRLGGDERLSRRHARVYLDDAGGAFVEDLGSTNGTWINEERIAESHVCANGELLRVGQSTFEIELPKLESPTRIDTVIEPVQRTVADVPPPPAIVLVTEGPKQGEEIELGDEFLIGRSFGEPGGLGGDRRLSRRHARIARGPGGVYFVEDTGSSNGTQVNGELLHRAQPLKDGDVIAVGSSVLEARGMPRAPMTDEPPPSPGAAPPWPAADPPPPPPAAPPWPAAEPPPPPPAAPPWPPPPPEPQQLSGQFIPQGAATGRLSHRRGRVIGIFAALFAAAAAASVAAVVLFAPLGSRACPSGFVCHKPLTAPPLRALKAFTGSLGWRVEYDSQSVVVDTANAAANKVDLHESSSYDSQFLHVPGNSKTIGILIRGYPAASVSADAAMHKVADPIASSLVGATPAPSSDQLFDRPVLGFHTAVGEVLEGNARTPQGPGPLIKLAVVAASAGGVSVAMAIVYPVQVGDTQANNPDQPWDYFGDQVLGTVRFPSDGVT